MAPTELRRSSYIPTLLFGFVLPLLFAIFLVDIRPFHTKKHGTHRLSSVRAVHLNDVLDVIIFGEKCFLRLSVRQNTHSRLGPKRRVFLG
jgi:hypothetical protein